jgi:polyketide synthase PksN
VALHRAVTAIVQGDCDQVVVGGVNALISPNLFISFGKAGMLAADGKCKTFSKEADGYVRGEGVGAIFIKKLSQALKDGDHIYGVVRGTGIKHGGKTSGLTVPNPDLQAELIEETYAKGNINPEHVSYIEAHGTGTSLGDPIEIEGIKKAFKNLLKDKPKSEKQDKDTQLTCGIGSVKTNIGHLESAAGMAGIIKLLLSFKHKTIPASINFTELNPYIDLKGTPFYINTKTKVWEQLKGENGTDGQEYLIPRMAGVSSFGFGGAYAHSVLEEYDTEKLDQARQPEKVQPRIFTLSAKSEERLKEYVQSYVTFLEADAVPKSNQQINASPNPLRFDDLIYTSQVGREVFDERLACVANTKSELKEKLEQYLKLSKNESGNGSGVFVGSMKQSEDKNSAVFKLQQQQLLEEVPFLDFSNPELRMKLEALAELFSKGFSIDFNFLYQNLSENEKPKRVSLPGITRPVKPITLPK